MQVVILDESLFGIQVKLIIMMMLYSTWGRRSCSQFLHCSNLGIMQQLRAEQHLGELHTFAMAESSDYEIMLHGTAAAFQLG